MIKDVRQLLPIPTPPNLPTRMQRKNPLPQLTDRFLSRRRDIDLTIHRHASLVHIRAAERHENIVDQHQLRVNIDFPVRHLLTRIQTARAQSREAQDRDG